MGKSKLKGFSIGFIRFIGRERLLGWCGCKILYACKRKGSFLSSHQGHSLSSQFYVLPQGRVCCKLPSRVIRILRCRLLANNTSG